MSRFASQSRTAPGGFPTAAESPARNYNGGVGVATDLRTEVFLLGTTFLADSHYESEAVRIKRYVDAIHAVAAEDPEWLASFLPWLRGSANIRTAAVIGGVEAARALRGRTDRHTSGRHILASCLQRADEPAEALAYYLSTYGKPIPMAVKKGIAEAASRLYTEFAAIKYANRDASIQPGDVIALCRPMPWKFNGQSELFQYLLDLRHNRPDVRIAESLTTIANYRRWLREPSLDLPEGIPWEMAQSKAGEVKIPKADVWAALIDGDRLGYMAMIRNLRAMVEAGVDDAHLDTVASRIADPQRVLNSKQLPFRFLSAYREASMRFHWPLQQALNIALSNWPKYPGRTLIAVDTSASMRQQTVGGQKGTILPVEVAALFAGALNSANRGNTTVGIYADNAALVEDLPPDALTAAQQLLGAVGTVGHGTQTWPSVEALIARTGRPDRVVVITDMQDHPARGLVFPNRMYARSHDHGPAPESLPPTYVFDLMGYKVASVDGSRGRYLFSGMSDILFSLPPALESGAAGRWPWEG